MIGAAIAASASASSTAPVGLEGEARITALVRGVIAAARSSARSAKPSAALVGIETAFAPLSAAAGAWAA